eukprot:gb/GEZJ01005495.1/.p1 GENE.gb/GEZJ01005495.1/~~gb/GEZJ01005495.1/.p1  ORF type:complete len:114 (+),score=10.51 gb/GEZJ01005495.1/:824-1165(+)
MRNICPLNVPRVRICLTFKTLDRTLQALHLKKPQIFYDHMRIWNLDKTTSVNALYEKKVKLFSPKDTHFSGRRHNTKENGKHSTARIATSAAGLMTPPFFIAAGKRAIPSWMN